MAVQHYNVQKTVDCISEWVKKWKMKLSESKTQYIIFRHQNKRKFPKLNLAVSKTVIEPMGNVKYLGITLDSHLTFKDHIFQILAKSMKKIGFISFLCLHKGFLPSIPSYLLLYNMVVRPTLEYGCAVWNGA